MLPEQSGLESRAAFTTDRGLLVLSWSGWLPDATGVSSDQACGRRLAELFPELDARGLTAQLEEAMSQDRVLVLSATLHGYLIPCPPQSASRWFDRMQQHVVATPIRDADGVVGLTVVLEDVTLRREQARDLAAHLAAVDEEDRIEALEEMSRSGGYEESMSAALGDPSWRVRQAARDAMAEAGDGAEEVLVGVLREQHRDLGALNAAIDAIVRRKEDPTPALLRLLADRDAEVRMYAAHTLGLTGRAHAVPDLLLALGDTDANVRYHAIEALGRLHAIEAGSTLMTIAEGNDPYLAFAALEAVALTGDGSLAERVSALTQHEELSEAAVRALGGVGDLGDVPTLTARLADDATCLAAVEALLAIDRRTGSFAVAQLVDAYAGAREVAELTRAHDRDGESAMDVLEVLGWIDQPQVDVVLAAALERPDQRHVAADALTRRRALEALLDVLDSGGFEARVRAAQALGLLCDARAVPALIAQLDEDNPVALAAVGALMAISDVRAQEPLLRLFDAHDVALRHAAVGALNSGPYSDLVERAEPLLGNPSPRVREAAARVVGYFAPPQLEERFVALMEDDDEGVRVAAAEHLGDFSGEGARSALRRALSDRAVSVRCAAGRTLAQVETSAAVPLLLVAIEDANLWVRYVAVRSAARHRDDRLLSPLEELAARDPAPPVRIAALEALGEVGSPAVVELAADAVASSDPDLAIAAVEATAALAAAARRVRGRYRILVTASRSQDARVREAAMRELGATLLPEAAPMLAEHAASDAEPTVARAAMDALIRGGGMDGVARVLALLGDRLVGDVASAALAHAPATAAEAVGMGLELPEPALRLEVVHSLRTIPGPAATSALVRALEDPSPAVRVEAHRALESRDLSDLLEGPLQVSSGGLKGGGR